MITTAYACLISVLASSNQGASTVSPSVISSYASKTDSSDVSSSVHGSKCIDPPSMNLNVTFVFSATLRQGDVCVCERERGGELKLLCKIRLIKF